VVDAAPDVRLREITAPDDPSLTALADLLGWTFADPNLILSAARMRAFLQANAAPPGEDAAGPRRDFLVLVAETPEPARLLGGTVFSYVPASGCGFSEYLVLDAAARGQGLGRRLIEARGERLDAAAKAAGLASAHGLFIEVEDPRRIPPAFARAEAKTAMEPDARIRLFAHLGFRRVVVPYSQPPLGNNQPSVEYLQLLFAPRDPGREAIPAAWVLDTLAAIWTAWAPDAADAFLAALAATLPTPTVPLRDALAPDA
jgi:GNAT superfamily N-acetyltransferase